MKPCFSYYNCPHCERKAMCETYQRHKRLLKEGKTNYELLIERPELTFEP